MSSNEINAQYVITRKDPFAKEWTITDTQTSSNYILEFHITSPDLLKDPSGSTISTVKNDGFTGMTKKMVFTRDKCQANIEWSGKLTSMSITAKGTTTTPGFEQINWKMNMNKEAWRLDIIDTATNETISKFWHSYRAYNEVGKLEILKDGLEGDLKLFLAYLSGYTFRHLLSELPQLGWDMTK
jgi:hypothetical protein